MQSENRKENIWRPIYEMPADNTSFYNTYFRTEEEYTLFRKEHTNKKEVPLLLQNPDYPNGCEAASMVMVLQYLGVNISLKDFIENYLEKENVYEKEGERFGPDPAISYAGEGIRACFNFSCSWVYSFNHNALEIIRISSNNKGMYFFIFFIIFSFRIYFLFYYTTFLYVFVFFCPI